MARHLGVALACDPDMTDICPLKFAGNRWNPCISCKISAVREDWLNVCSVCVCLFAYDLITLITTLFRRERLGEDVGTCCISNVGVVKTRWWLLAIGCICNFIYHVQYLFCNALSSRLSCDTKTQWQLIGKSNTQLLVRKIIHKVIEYIVKLYF